MEALGEELAQNLHLKLADFVGIGVPADTLSLQ